MVPNIVPSKEPMSSDSGAVADISTGGGAGTVIYHKATMRTLWVLYKTRWPHCAQQVKRLMKIPCQHHANST